MKNKKIKCLILIVALFIARSQLYVFSETKTNSGESSNNGNVTVTPQKEGTTILDGQIGEWDPTDNNAPNFNQEGLEIEGNKPVAGEYYTISVTVPLNMEFMVLQSSQLAFGSFFSPEYSITNNGSKTLDVKVKSFERDTKITIPSDKTELYVEKVKHGDKKVQMELKLSGIDSLGTGTNKDVDLTDVTSLSDEQRKLHELQKNETKKVKFSAEKWELPKSEGYDTDAISNFTAGLEFSIKDNTN